LQAEAFRDGVIEVANEEGRHSDSVMCYREWRQADVM